MSITKPEDISSCLSRNGRSRLKQIHVSTQFDNLEKSARHSVFEPNDVITEDYAIRLPRNQATEVHEDVMSAYKKIIP